MIQSLLLKKDGNWEIPNQTLLTLLEQRVNACATKCDKTIQRLPFLSSDRVGAQDFKIHLRLLRDRVTVLSGRIGEFRQVTIQDLEREAITALLVEFSAAVCKLKRLNINSSLFDAADRIFFDRFFDKLHQAIGEKPIKGRVDISCGEQLLHTAARDGQKELVELLLSQGANVNVADSHGMRPLHFAAENNQREIAELLLTKGADIRAAANDGEQPLHLAARDGHKEIVKLLICKGADVNAIRSDGCQPLHWAIANDHDEIVELLLIKGANIHKATNDGWLPLQVAERIDNSLIVEMLNRTSQLEPLFKVYREKGHLARFLDKKLFPIDRSYINLALLEQESFEDLEREARDLDRYNAQDTFYRDTKLVSLSELFEGNSHVYIEGDAGSGKTTLCHFLVYIWATRTKEERLQILGSWGESYDAVIWLPLRDIRSLEKSATLQDLVNKIYPGFSFESLDPQKTLYILDGFDEIASLEESSAQPNADKRWKIVTTLLSQSNWIITSRPNLYSEKFWNSRRLQNLGFTDKNIGAYIDRFSEDFKVDGSSLQKAVLKREDLKALAHIPLYLELVCSLWKENPTFLTQMNSLGALYDGIAVQLFRRHLRRFFSIDTAALLDKEILEHTSVKPYLQHLEEVSFQSRESGGNRITPEIYQPVLQKVLAENRKSFGERLFNELGFLSPTGDPKELLKQDYAFLHPTFEEYFSARHVVSVLGSRNKLVNNQTAADWLKANILAKDKEIVIDFIACLATSKEQLNALANALQLIKPKTFQRLLNTLSSSSKPKRSVSAAIPAKSQVSEPEFVNGGRRAGSTIIFSPDCSKTPPLSSANSAMVEPPALSARSPGLPAGIAGVSVRTVYPLHGVPYQVLLPLARIRNVDVLWEYSLHRASQLGLLQLARILIEKGAKVNAIDPNGRQPVHEAAHYGHKEVVALLLKKGVRVNASDTNGSQPLHEAAIRGHKEVAALLLDKSAQVDAVDYYGSQPLQWAAINGHQEVVELLLSKGAQFDVAKDNSWQPLIQAAGDGRKDTVKLLIEKGAKVDTVRNGGLQALHAAASGGHKEVVELLLQKGAKVDAVTNDGGQALHAAASGGQKGVVELLLQKGAKVDAATNDGRQALHWAAYYGYTEVVELLLQKGAKVEAADNEGWQALFLAAENGHKEVVELLLQKGANSGEALRWAAQKSRKEVVELLLLKGAKVGAADKDGRQALHAAASGGRKEVVELLLQKGAKVDEARNDGVQALHAAALNGQKEVVELLLQKGAKVDAADKDGRQALHWAVWDGYEEVVKLLLQKGAKVDAASSDGVQALHSAAYKGFKGVVELLLLKGAKVGAARNDGVQALHSAASNGQKEVVELLLQKGAKVDAAINDGSQALHSAASNGHKEVVELLLQKGAKVDAADKFGYHALHLAAWIGSIEVVELLLQKGAKVDAATNNGLKPLDIAKEKGYLEIARLMELRT